MHAVKFFFAISIAQIHSTVMSQIGENGRQRPIPCHGNKDCIFLLDYNNHNKPTYIEAL